MKKILSVLLLFIVGFILIGSAVVQYFSSGNILAEFPLELSGKTGGSCLLAPDMNPVRVLLKTRYFSHSKSNHVTFYEFEITLHERSGSEEWRGTGELGRDRDVKGLSEEDTAAHHCPVHDLGMLSVARTASYDWQVRLTTKDAVLKEASLLLRRNVATVFPQRLWVGLGVIALGILFVFLGIGAKLKRV